jgi:drug/metabolite transporter (DMT)-like permease
MPVDPGDRPPMRGSEGVPWRGLLLLLALATLWGASYTLIRIGVTTIPPLTLMALRTAIAGAILWGCAIAQNQALPRAPRLWAQFFVQAAFNSVLPFTMVAWAEQRVPAGVAVILNSMTPIFTVVLTWVITRHERITTRRLVGVALGLAGVILAIGRSALDGWNGDLVPQLAVLVASVCYAIAAIYGHGFRELSPLLPAAGSMTCGAVLLIPASLVFDAPWSLHVSTASLLALLALAVFSTALAFVLYFRLIQTLGSLGTTSQAFLRVPIGVAIGVIFLHESLAVTAWLGLLAVMAGVAMLNLAGPRRPSHSRPTARVTRRVRDRPDGKKE